MEKLLKSRRESFDAICYIIKALALFFCFYPLFDVFFRYSPKNSLTELNLRSMVTSIILLVLVLSIWLVLQPNNNARPFKKWLEICVFYGICFASVVVSGGCESDYKFMFVFMVVTYTIQYGMSYGLIITIAASVTLIGMNLALEESNSKILQSDIALSIMFGILSYILGRYMRLEREHINELMHLANHDGLTNLYNHRYFHEAMDTHWKAAREEGKAVGLLMLDIDYFKMYNDIRGHQDGDRVLERIAQIIQENVGPKDVVCRYGGEEFAVVIPSADENDCIGLAEKIRTTVLNEPFEGEEYLPGNKLTISLGVALSGSDDSSYNEVVSRADDALYRAKYLRKNRVETYQNVFDRFDDLDENTKSSLLSVKGLVGIINVRDDYTYSHTERVVFCCDIAAKHIGLSKNETRMLLISAYMHDIGKINIPREVLISGRRLKDDEWALIEKHPTEGQAILSQIAGMGEIGQIVAQHHERFDGTGYPGKLSGEQIHPLASILALADAFDAMTNDRPYQKKRTYKAALEEIRLCSGKQFNPKYTELFIEAVENELIPEWKSNGILTSENVTAGEK